MSSWPAEISASHKSRPAKIMATFGIKQRSRGADVIGVLEEIYGIKKVTSKDAGSTKKAGKKRVKKASSTTNKGAGNNSGVKEKTAAKRKKASPKKSPPRKRPAKKDATQK